jgi:hypothetical protein
MNDSAPELMNSHSMLSTSSVGTKKRSMETTESSIGDNKSNDPTSRTHRRNPSGSSTASSLSVAGCYSFDSFQKSGMSYQAKLGNYLFDASYISLLLKRLLLQELPVTITP